MFDAYDHLLVDISCLVNADYRTIVRHDAFRRGAVSVAPHSKSSPRAMAKNRKRRQSSRTLARNGGSPIESASAASIVCLTQMTRLRRQVRTGKREGRPCLAGRSTRAQYEYHIELVGALLAAGLQVASRAHHGRNGAIAGRSPRAARRADVARPSTIARSSHVTPRRRPRSTRHPARWATTTRRRSTTRTACTA